MKVQSRVVAIHYLLQPMTGQKSFVKSTVVLMRRNSGSMSIIRNELQVFFSIYEHFQAQIQIFGNM
jgi:hypothetical protein